MSPEERKSAENEIWLCQSCSKLIDDDIIRYNVDLLYIWKENAERLAIAELQSASPVSTNNKDKVLLRFYVQCFDRPAFQDRISQEGRIEDFDQAIEDTIIALNTGVLRTQDGVIIKQSEGKSAIINHAWREKLNTITDMLVALRKRLKIAKDENLYSTYGKGEVMYCFYDQELETWFDLTREEIIKILSSICQEAGISGLHFPRLPYRW
ncbi:MAG TPA: HNH endonuclease [Clostridiales bacterium]|nr:HNH endonuclease [Clostridiales bacterium]